MKTLVFKRESLTERTVDEFPNQPGIVKRCKGYLYANL